MTTEKEAALIAGLLRSGMRETACALCGCQLWNREPMDPSVCPPCKRIAESGAAAEPLRLTGRSERVHAAIPRERLALYTIEQRLAADCDFSNDCACDVCLDEPLWQPDDPIEIDG